MGLSVTQYLNQFRLTKAKQLLSETDFSITRICFDVGFNSLTHFERVFKHIEGQSPSEYRKANPLKKVKKVAKEATDVGHFSFPDVILKESMMIGEKHAAGRTK
jgi:AraC-like DNA-binding protein